MEPGGFEYESFIRCQKRGYKLQRLTPELVKDFFPRISYGKYKDGYFNPKAGWVEAGALLKLLIEEAKNLGVLVKPGIKITHLLNEGERIVGASTEKGIQIKADYFLVAAGAWSSLLMPELKDLMCATGQPVFYVQLGDGMESQLPKYASTWLADISKTGWYGFPPLPHCWIKIANHGPGRKIHPDDPREVTKEDELHLRQFLTENIPILADALIVKTRLCPYTDTWDSNFYIDHVPNQPGLLVASGGSGHAFKFAPVLGTIIADVIERKPNPFAYRFAWREKGEITHEEERSE
jgi:sarcosine oxidase / L-pipecolate oxidase